MIQPFSTFFELIKHHWLCFAIFTTKRRWIHVYIRLKQRSRFRKNYAISVPSCRSRRIYIWCRFLAMKNMLLILLFSKWPNGDYYWQRSQVTGSSWWKTPSQKFRILFAKLGEEKYCIHSRFLYHREESYN